jgi:phosphatidylethanolamine/phosphatidyl-N-methylethanolamine N-methyltransferase
MAGATKCRNASRHSLWREKRIASVDETPSRNNRKLKRNGNLAFFLGFLRKPEQVGSVIPSSRFLERRLVTVAGVSTARVVVELGPGTGGTTRAILHALPPGAKLLAIEIDDYFAAMLESLHDPRLIVHRGSAEDFQHILAQHGLAHADAVISGIPFSTMPQETGRSILNAVWNGLAPGGRLVAYQVRGKVASLGRKLFGHPKVQVEFLNAPPVRVYHWLKPPAAMGPGKPASAQ